MDNSPAIRAPTNYLRVDLDDPAEAEYWLIVLDAARPQVEEAVVSVGRDARDVAAFLRESRFRAAQREPPRQSWVPSSPNRSVARTPSPRK
jgi:hypothetical protein